MKVFAQAAPTRVFNVKDPAFGAVGDGAADDTGAIQRAVNAALADGTAGGIVWLPAGRYRITKPLRLNEIMQPNGTVTAAVFDKPLTLQGVGDASVILVENHPHWPGPNKTALWASGMAETKVRPPADLIPGSRQVVVHATVASTLERGSVLALEDPAGPPAFKPNYKPFELHKVVSKDGNTIELDAPLRFGYSAATAWTYKMTVLHGLTVRDLSMTAVNDPTIPDVDKEAGNPAAGKWTYGVYATFFVQTVNTVIENVRLFNAAGGFQLMNALDAHITDCTIDTLPRYQDAFAYGVSINGSSRNVTILGLVGRATRHLFTTLSDSRGEEVAYGGPTDVRVIGGIGEGGDLRADGMKPASVWDTHEPGSDISFIGCTAIGGADGFQMRATNIEIVDCVASYNELYGIRPCPTCEKVTIRGGEVIGNGRAGIVPQAAPNTSIEGVRIVGNGWEGVRIEGIPWNNPTQGTGRVQVTDCDIRDNGNAGIFDQSPAGWKATDVLIARNNIPKSAIAGRQPRSLRGLGPNSIVVDNVLRGYGTSDGTFELDAAVLKQNNVTG